MVKYWGTPEPDSRKVPRYPRRLDTLSIDFPYTRPGSFDPPIPTAEDVENRGTSLRALMAGLNLSSGCFRSTWSRSQTVRNYLKRQKTSCFSTDLRPSEASAYLPYFPNQGADPLHLRTTYKYNGPLPEYHYIVMEYIEGDTLDKLWRNLSDEHKNIVCSKLGRQLRYLQDIPQPGSQPYYGRVGNKGWRSDHKPFWTPRNEVRGPFASYHDLVNGMYEGAEFNIANSFVIQGGYSTHQITELDMFKQKLLDCSSQDQQPTFTHPDLTFINIIVNPIKEGTDYEVTIIDWECAGWLPRWATTGILQIGLWPNYNDVRESAKDSFKPFLSRVLGELEPISAEVSEFVENYLSNYETNYWFI